jgi:sulfide:quinone oxidoreductase
MKYDVVIVGAGSAGVSVAARLRRLGVESIALIDPARTHWYQPLWTLVGRGVVSSKSTSRSMSKVIPQGVSWIPAAVKNIDPKTNSVILEDETRVSYEWLVVAAGIQLDWQKISGLPETLGRNGVSSNYLPELAELTWSNVRKLSRGTAVFTMPPGAIKCAGAPQKAAYLSCDHWMKQGVLGSIDVHYVTATPGMFGIKSFSDVLDGVVKRYGIKTHFKSEVVSINGVKQEMVIRNIDTQQETTIKFDLAHVVPPQSAPDWLKSTPLADKDNPAGYVKVDKHTLRHVEFPNVFSLGDCSSAPTSKTGAAIRKQAPVLAANLKAAMDGKPLAASYNGYASCPLVTSTNTCVLAEFDYDLKPTPTFPFITMAKERRDMWILKRWILPQVYWWLMLRGLA